MCVIQVGRGGVIVMVRTLVTAAAVVLGYWLPLLLLRLPVRLVGGAGGKRGAERAAEMKLFEDARRRAAQSSTTKGTAFANTTVWAAMILTDPMTAGVLGRDFYRVPQGVNGTAVDNAYRRIEHAKETVKTFPFPVDMWWSVYAPECPGRKTKGNDRGVAMAHYQVWADWDFQGRKGADKATAKDTDVLVVFEDDAVAAVKDVVKALAHELSPQVMRSDLNFLGWCYGRRGMPMCTHAYAITRLGASTVRRARGPPSSCTAIIIVVFFYSSSSFLLS